MDGYEVARRIRALPGGKDVFLVAMTGWGQQQDKQKATEAGFDVHLTKPADPGELGTLLEHRAREKLKALSARR
jgi:CheY-like chemotaxis protein